MCAMTRSAAGWEAFHVGKGKSLSVVVVGSGLGFLPLVRDVCVDHANYLNPKAEVCAGRVEEGYIYSFWLGGVG